MKNKKISSTQVSINLVIMLMVTGMSGCSSNEPDPNLPPPIPPCNYQAFNSLNAQINDYIWSDSRHATFDRQWRQQSLEQIYRKYFYLDRKGLPEAEQAQFEVKQYEENLVQLKRVNNDLTASINSGQCLVGDKNQTPGKIEQMNQGIEFMLQSLPALYAEIASKKSIIIETLEQR